MLQYARLLQDVHFRATASFQPADFCLKLACEVTSVKLSQKPRICIFDSRLGLREDECAFLHNVSLS